MACHDMLNVPLRTFGGVPLIDLCAMAQCTNLLGLPCCQSLLDERWLGVLYHVPFWVRWSSRLLPVVGVIYLDYKAKAKHARKKNQSVTNKRHSKSLSVASNLALGEQQTSFSGLKSRTNPRWHFIIGVYRSPAMKFCLHSICHLLFLYFFSVVCVRRLYSHIAAEEAITLAYLTGYAMEEFRQIAYAGLRDGLMLYFNDGWNWMDLLAISLTAFGFCIRLMAPDYKRGTSLEAQDTILSSTRNLYMLGLHVFYMRTLYITSISPIIGPRLKMMVDMLRKDLVPLLLVFAIFICSYGVWFQGLIYPNSFYETRARRDLAGLSNNSMDVNRLGIPTSLGQGFRRAFYGIFEVSTVLDAQACKDDVYCGNEAGYNVVIYFVLVLYTGSVNIILINLLIALFSNTVSRIEQESNALWLAGRYKMVKEYSERSILPPPFNILCISGELLNCIYHQIVQRCQTRRQTRQRVSPHPLIREQQQQQSRRSGSRVFTFDSNAYPGGWDENGAHTDDCEINAVLRFVVLQSFALQDRRETLGWTKLTGSRVTNQIDGDRYFAQWEDSFENKLLKTEAELLEQRLNKMDYKMRSIFYKLDTLIEIERVTVSNKKLQRSFSEGDDPTGITYDLHR